MCLITRRLKRLVCKILWNYLSLLNRWVMRGLNAWSLTFWANHNSTVQDLLFLLHFQMLANVFVIVSGFCEYLQALNWWRCTIITWVAHPYFWIPLAVLVATKVYADFHYKLFGKGSRCNCIKCMFSEDVPSSFGPLRRTSGILLPSWSCGRFISTVTTNYFVKEVGNCIKCMFSIQWSNNETRNNFKKCLMRNNFE